MGIAQQLHYLFLKKLKNSVDRAPFPHINKCNTLWAQAPNIIANLINIKSKLTQLKSRLITQSVCDGITSALSVV